MSEEVTRIIKLSEIKEEDILVTIHTLFGDEDDMAYADEDESINVENIGDDDGREKDTNGDESSDGGYSTGVESCNEEQTPTE